jgi:hypothetical protein
MFSPCRSKPPVIFCSLIRLASLAVAADVRIAWRRRWIAALDNLWVLVERGELPLSRSAFLAACCREAVANAGLTRFRGFDARRWVRGPGFLLGVMAASLLVIAIGSHTFAATRSLLDAFHGTHSVPKNDRLVANLLPVAFGVAVSAIAALGRISEGGHSWRERAFQLAKIAGLFMTLSLLWIEGGAAVRAMISNETLRVVAGGLLLAVAFIAATGSSILWAFADQRQRCPVCLRRLVLPVRMGTWSSVLEPVTTEWICDCGHGALCIREIEAGEPDRWTHREHGASIPAA